MKIHKNLFGTNGQDKIDVDEIAIAKDLLLGDAVPIEIGNRYMCYGDGKQVCWGSISIPGTDWIPTSWGFYSPMKEVPFPKKFVENPFHISSSADAAISGRSAWLSYTGVTTTSIRVYVSALVTYSNSVTVQYLAIGKWK